MIELDDCFAIEKVFKYMNQMVIPYYNFEKFGFKNIYADEFKEELY